jgi:hypothetical protein
MQTSTILTFEPEVIAIFHKGIIMSDLWKNREALLYSAWPNIGNIVNSILEKVIPIIPTMNESPPVCDQFSKIAALGTINICRFLLVMGVIIVVLSSVCAVRMYVRVRVHKRKTNRVKIAIICAVIGLVIALLAIRLGNFAPIWFQPVPRCN